MEKMVVLGDSVAWGQGLLADQKYATQVSQHLGVQPGDLSTFAHSGAVIGVDFDGNTSTAASEVPKAAPTILDQVDQVPSPASVDYVLMKGGINDVDIRTILDPLTTLSDLRAATLKACHDDMGELLKKVTATFTNSTCQVFITGYYPILSRASKLVSDLGDDLLGLLLNHHGLAIPRFIDKNLVVGHIVSLALQFWQDSDAQLEKAVLETAAASGWGNRLRFIPTGFTVNNALFAGTPFLFGLTPQLGTQDDAAKDRASSCSLAYPDPLDVIVREACCYASVGHPNEVGAGKIAQAILGVLQPA